MSSSEAVGITGIGLTCALGSTPADVSSNLRSGQSGLARVSRFPVDDHPCQIAALIEKIPCPATYQPDRFAALLPLEQCALWSCWSALANAGLDGLTQDLRIGLVLGVGAEWMQIWEADRRHGGARITSPELDTACVAAWLKSELRLSGPRMTISAACASGNWALAQGRQWLQSGWVDVCLAGSVDMGVSPSSLASFGNLRALSRRNSEPLTAVRPFDASRDGMVLGEGGAMMVLERTKDANARGRRPAVEIAGFGASSDAHHLVIPSPEQSSAAEAIRQALEEADIAPDDLDYINAHATGTVVGDAGETLALQLALGQNVQNIPISSTKSQTGHLLSAAAALEAAICTMAIQEQYLPATINLTEIAPACRGLHHILGQARSQAVQCVLSNSFGFGGSNTSLVLRAAV